MLRHFVKIAARNVLKFKIFSFINITGLAIGMAGAIILLLWVQNQLNIDQFHQKKDNIYKLYANKETDGKTITYPNISAPLAEIIKKEVPEIKQLIRISDGSKLFRYAENKINAEGNYIDPGFLTMFSFPLISGNPETVLSDKKSIIISEKLAKFLFKSEDPVNKVVKTDGGEDYIVSGVIKDLNENTQFKFDFLLPWQALENHNPSNSAWTTSINAFVEVGNHANIKNIEAKITNIQTRLAPKSDRATIFLYPLSRIWLESNFQNGKPSGGIIDLVHILEIIALIIILIACINFINLSTARSLKRAKEVGMRKVMGGSRITLIWQFIGESVLLTFLAGIIAFVLVILVLPYFNAITEKHLTIPYGSVTFWIRLLLFLLITGVIAGIYPAFYLSAFNPVKALKGVISHGNAFVKPGKVLFVCQFIVAIVLINFTILLKRQILHLENRETGYNTQNLLFHRMNPDLKANYSILKNELLQSGAVTYISKSNKPITQSGATEDELDWAGKDKNDKTDFDIRTSQQDFVNTTGLTLIKGRDIDVTDFPADSNSCLINETAAKLIGFTSPIGQKIKEGEQTWTIVGIVKDFITSSTLQAISPVLIKGSDNENFINIRINPANAMADNVKTVTAIIRKYNRNFITEPRFADEDYNLKVRGLKLTATLTNIFAGLSIFISCLGLLGLVIYTTETKSKEISIRKVFGADIFSILSLLSRDFLVLVTISILIASPIAWLVMSSFLRPIYYRTNLSIAILIEGAAIALLITIATISSQSLKAVLINPIKNLRNE